MLCQPVAEFICKVKYDDDDDDDEEAGGLQCSAVFLLITAESAA